MFSLQFQTHKNLIDEIEKESSKELKNINNIICISELLRFRVSGTKFVDDHGKYFLMPNIEHIVEYTGVNKRQSYSILNVLANELKLIKKVKVQCRDYGVRFKIYITKKYINIVSGIESIPKKNVLEKKPSKPCKLAQEPIKHIDLPISGKSDFPILDKSLYKLGHAKIWGQCNISVGVCNYNVAQSIKIIAMPWGSVDSPNCAGFTPAELQLIDFSKIDLSEYTNSLQQQQFSQQDQDNLSKQAQESAQSFKQNYQTGAPVDNPSPVSDQVVSVSPTSGVGGSTQNPFTVTLYSASNFPKYYPYSVCGYPSTNNNTNTISSISINWGDGTPVQTISSTKIIQAQGYEYSNQVPCEYSVPEFVVTHTYAAPSTQKTTTIPITVQLNTKNNGLQTTTASIQNIWENGSQLTGIGQGGNSKLINDQKAINVMPGSGSYNPQDIPGIQKYN